MPLGLRTNHTRLGDIEVIEHVFGAIEFLFEIFCCRRRSCGFFMVFDQTSSLNCSMVKPASRTIAAMV
jgi:hypothetical protein